MANERMPNVPRIRDIDIIRDIIRQYDLELEKYASLLKLVNDNEEFMSWVQDKIREPFSDDLDGLYHDIESLLTARDFLATIAAAATAHYRAAKKRFLPAKGTQVDKEAAQNHDAAPYKFYEKALDERIKSLDNRCTAGKQQQRIIEEAIKRNLVQD